MENTGISIILPCYNQGPVLFRHISIIRNFCEGLGRPYEIIAVNDGSTDDTAFILQEAQKLGVVVYTHTKNMGKGKAVQTGILAAQHPLSLFLDADLAIPITETSKFLQIFEESPHIQIVVASRFVAGYTTLVPVLWHRKVLEYVFRFLRKAIIGVWQVEDTQCGFKMFRTESAKDLFRTLTCNRFSFDAELLFIATQWNMKIQELPVALQNPPVSSIRIGKDSLRMFFDLFKIRWQNLWGWYQKLEYVCANITLDDFGIHPAVNERILAVCRHPRVARIAVLVGGEWSVEERDALLLSGKKIDIHLELPIAPTERAAHGNFFVRLSWFLASVWRGELQPRQVERSWRQQIEKFQELFGRLPDGINSHEHTHFFPWFFKVSLQFSKEYKIPFVRLGKRGGICWHPVALVLSILRVINRAFVGRPKYTSDTLFSHDWGIRPSDLAHTTAEILYHVERDEEWVHLQ